METWWLSYTNLSDHYERKARFLPAVLSILPLLPVSAVMDGPFSEWVNLIVGGVGIGAIVAVGLSHAASAMGNRLQKRLWPRWPHDSPTNSWLHPSEGRTSKQQRELWYAAATRLVGIDIREAVTSGEEVEATINDVVSALRNVFWNRSEAERLRMHNVDYGFARNFAGMRPIWVGSTLTSAATCWIAYFVAGRDVLLWAAVSTLLAVVLVPLAFWVLPGYVRTKATYYAESFFDTLRALDQAYGGSGSSRPTGRPSDAGGSEG